MPITRRDFLLASALGAALASGKGWAGRLAAKATERRDRYPQGVASGDPTADSVILWTRRPPSADDTARAGCWSRSRKRPISPTWSPAAAPRWGRTPTGPAASSPRV